MSHWRVDDDDEEAVQLQSPLRQGVGKGLQMRSRGNGSLQRRKSIFVAPLIFFLIFREYIGARSRSGGAREATSLPTTASPLVAEWGLVGSL